jgi:hypothetical protein
MLAMTGMVLMRMMRVTSSEMLECCHWLGNVL